MSTVIADMSISLDGYIAGPNDSVDNPLGDGGERLHDWMTGQEAWRETHGLEGGDRGADNAIAAEYIENLGASIMGRGMFSNGEGPWGDDPFRGYWGDEPPFHTPVFVLTHHARDPLSMAGGTTFHFVTGGFEAALDRAREAAGDRDVRISGGAATVRQYLAAGLLDQLHLHIVPIALGGGIRLLDGFGPDDLSLEPDRVVTSPAVTHIRYRVITSQDRPASHRRNAR